MKKPFWSLNLSAPVLMALATMSNVSEKINYYYFVAKVLIVLIKRSLMF